MHHTEATASRGHPFHRPHTYRSRHHRHPSLQTFRSLRQFKRQCQTTFLRIEHPRGGLELTICLRIMLRSRTPIAICTVRHSLYPFRDFINNTHRQASRAFGGHPRDSWRFRNTCHSHVLVAVRTGGAGSMRSTWRSIPIAPKAGQEVVERGDDTLVRRLQLGTYAWNSRVSHVARNFVPFVRFADLSNCSEMAPK